MAEQQPQPPRRRTADRVPADVKLYVSDEVAETRHLLRGEMGEAFVQLRNDLASIRQDVQVGNLQSVTEMARMQASLEELKRDVPELRKQLERIEPRVGRLETYVATAAASDAVREQAMERGQALRLSWPVWLLMAINTVLVLLALILHSS